MNERSKAEQILDGLSYLLTIGKVMTCAAHDEFFAGLEDDDLETPEVAARMEELGWLVAIEGGFMIFT